MTKRPILAMLGLLAGGGALVLTSGMLTPPPSPAPPPGLGQCRASGTKHLTPPISEAEACNRFLSAIASVPEVTAVTIEVLPQGVLKAVVTRTGTRGSPSDYALAVMDRAMTPADLDALARNVVADLGSPAAG